MRTTPPSGGPVYFLSDLHLDDTDHERSGRVMRFLRARRGEASAVYLCGDIFDFWLGYRTVVHGAYFGVLRAVAELVESGTRVVFLTGNHDPDPGSFLRDTLGAEVTEDGLDLELGGRRVRVDHGDLIDPRGLRHTALNRVAHARPLRWAARRLHPDTAWSLAGVYARLLGAHKDYSDLPRELVDAYFERRVDEGADVVVIGHYHRAVWHQTERAGRLRDFFVLGDWIRHDTYVRWRPEDGFQLLRDAGDDPPIPLGVGEHRPPASAR